MVWKNAPVPGGNISHPLFVPLASLPLQWTLMSGFCSNAWRQYSYRLCLHPCSCGWLRHLCNGPYKVHLTTLNSLYYQTCYSPYRPLYLPSHGLSCFPSSWLLRNIWKTYALTAVSVAEQLLGYTLLKLETPLDPKVNYELASSEPLDSANHAILTFNTTVTLKTTTEFVSKIIH